MSTRLDSSLGNFRQALAYFEDGVGVKSINECCSVFGLERNPPPTMS